jgi:hypothetical protein
MTWFSCYVLVFIKSYPSLFQRWWIFIEVLSGMPWFKCLMGFNILQTHFLLMSTCSIFSKGELIPVGSWVSLTAFLFEPGCISSLRFVISKHLKDLFVLSVENGSGKAKSEYWGAHCYGVDHWVLLWNKHVFVIRKMNTSLMFINSNSGSWGFFGFF